MACPPSKKLRVDPGKAGDPRLASLIIPFEEAAVGKTKVALVWFPSDEGTIRNAGRGGSRDSPGAVANLLQKMGTAVNPEEGVDLGAHIRLTEVGEATGGTLEEVHESLESLVGRALSSCAVPVVVGGSNDQSYCNASAWLAHNPKARQGTVINIDAHLDVRPLVNGQRHSGSPFYCLIQDDRFKGRLVEFAAQGSQCSKVHADFVESNRGAVFWLGSLRRLKHGPAGEFNELLQKTPGPIFVSFDVDAICSRDMPGVSCPSSVGLTAEEACEMARAAGECEKVELFDLSELNVAIEGDRSPRLVVNIIYNFLIGLACRRAKQASIV